MSFCATQGADGGFSWHAAAASTLSIVIQCGEAAGHTVQLYKEIQALSGQNVGLHFTGGLNVAATGQRWEHLRSEWARHRVLVWIRLDRPKEIRELCPLMDVSE